MTKIVGILAFLIVSVGCSAENSAEEETRTAQTTSSDSEATEEDKKDLEAKDSQVQNSKTDSEDQNNQSQDSDGLDVKSCNPPEGVNNAPETTEEFVTFLNALPKPTNLYCIVSALKRPLKVQATTNGTSAQPANGINSPRIFISFGNLRISVVPDGESSKAIETGEILTGNAQASIKGDIPLPIREDLKASDPYNNLYKNGNMLCGGLCHRNMTEVVEDFGNGVVSYASEILSISPNDEKTLFDLRLLRDACEDNKKPICDFYRSLFDHGKVESFRL